MYWSIEFLQSVCLLATISVGVVVLAKQYCEESTTKQVVAASPVSDSASSAAWKRFALKLRYRARLRRLYNAIGIALKSLKRD